MNRLKIILILLCVSAYFHTVAQSMTNAERHQVNLRMLELVEKYESALRTSRSFPFSKRNYVRLYTSPQDSVYSDLMDYNPGTYVKVEDLANELAQRSMLTCNVANLDKGVYMWRDGKWHISLYIDKTVSYSTVNPSRVAEPAKSIVQFKSDEYYQSPYRITLNCSYDPQTGRCSIESVEGNVASEMPHLSSRFMVVQRNGEKDKRIKVVGTPGDSLHFNRNEQAFVSHSAVKPWHDDVIILADTIATTRAFDHVKLNYKVLHWRAKVRFAMTLGSAFKVNSSSLKSLNFSSKSSSYEFGADVGYTTLVGKRTTLGVFTGLGMAFSSLSMETSAPFTYSYQLSDSKGVLYNRTYSINSMKEALKYNDVVIPIYLNFDHKLYKGLALEWSLGAKLYINGKVSVTPFTVDGNVVADYANGGTGAAAALGSISGEYDRFLLPDTYTRSAVDMSLMGGLGFKYGFLSNRLLVSAKFSYELGATQVHKSKGISMFDSEQQYYPVVYSARTKSNVATQSFMSAVSYNRQACWLEIGLTYKF